ncbi:hypothetical protein Agabi119p4_3903 [Agaricus bisporus var. burnettii]|uniref:Nuclear transport factor 2 n=1 Tax=Agaricus bisporus var. burnettii TaxID=192524 RepID=A0A8H7KI49_AGABI|nr:hypothetical protein Agabi119p4_3903 [Agaricus bisporus var. burnettii]
MIDSDLIYQFIRFYYSGFNEKRADLADIYGDDSKLIWEGTRVVGKAAIIEKLTSLPYKFKHKINKTDIHSMDNNNLTIVITGLLLIDDDTTPLHFSQVFILEQIEHSFRVQYEVFRLHYGGDV